MPRLSVTAPGPPAREALWATIAHGQRDDPLHPVTVAVPSPYAGLSLRRELAARSGLANVHFVALNRIAELLGAPFLGERRRPLTEALAAEATRLALCEVGRDLDTSRRTVDAVVRTRREAARSGIPLHGEMARVDEAVRARLTDYYDDEDQLHAAARVVADDPSRLEDLGDVVWYLPLRVTPGGAALARALDDTGRLTVVAAATGDAAADRVLDNLAAALDAPEAGDTTPPNPPESTPHGTEILVAPDHDTEVRAVVSRILALAAEGVGFHRVAVTFTHDEPYLRLAHARLAAAGIPVAGPSSRRLAETAAGRVVGGVVTALDEELSRDSVLDLLAVAPLRHDLATAATVARWDAISRHAGIVAGADEWEARLAGWRSRHPERDDEVAALVEVVGALIPPATSTDDDATWRTHVEHLERVLDLLLGDGSHLPTDEQDALVEVRAALRSLATLATLGGDSPAVDAFADAARAALDGPFGRAGVVGTGVLVAPMTSLAGTACDVVFVLGLDEHATRSAALDDPLLPGHDLARARRDRHRGAYLAALAAAPHRVLSLPRADLRAQRATTPSPWVLESAAALAGCPVATEELLAADAEWPWLRTIASFEAQVADDPSAPDDAHLAALAAHRPTAGPGEWATDGDLVDGALARGFAATIARAAPVGDAWDGVVGPLEGLAPDGDHPLSATRLEAWAICPFRYFLRSVLRVEEPERPEALERIDPRARGTLVHEALREFLAAHVGKPPDERWFDAERAELVAIVERRADDAAEEGLVGHPTLWAIDRRKLVASAGVFLDVDERLRAAHGVSPWYQEVAFGDGDDDELPPLDLELGDHRVRVRGRIDRVDRSPDGQRIEVYDYKTGRPRTDQLVDDPIDGGRLLQPVLYAMVMRRAAPDATVGFHYWYTQAPEHETLDGLEAVDDDAVDRLTGALEVVVGAIAAGTFPREPGDDGYYGPDHCRYCDFDRICPADRVATAEARYPDDPAFVPLRRLRGDGPEPQAQR